MDSLENTIRNEEPFFTRNAILQSLNSSNGEKLCYVVVEDDYDKTVYGKFMINSSVAILNSSEKENDKVRKGCKQLERIVSEILVEHSSAHIIGIRDADYSRFSPSYSLPKNVFRTDARDIEMQMISCTSVATSMAADFKSWSNDYCTVVPVARIIGYYRIYNEFHQLGWMLRNAIKQSLLWNQDSKSWRSDWQNAFSTENIGNNVPSASEINDFASRQSLDKKADSIICRGHDIIKFMSWFSPIQKIHLELARRYSMDAFSTSTLFNDIDSWSKSEGVSIWK